jgi:hypothetical protein
VPAADSNIDNSTSSSRPSVIGSPLVAPVFADFGFAVETTEVDGKRVKCVNNRRLGVNLRP